MTLDQLNHCSKDQLREELLKCCGASRWAEEMLNAFPFENEEAFFTQAGNLWYERCDTFDWRAAFTHHPKIGDIQSLKERFAATAEHSAHEQSGIGNAQMETLEELALANEAYEAKFDFIFIVNASGKSAQEMLELLKDRMQNKEEDELRVAMGEQHKITLIRLCKLLEKDATSLPVSHITTHVLDTALGLPGRMMRIRLFQQGEKGWELLTQGITNADGRIANLLPAFRLLKPGAYQMHFDTAQYFTQNDTVGFYPGVDIHFTVFDPNHYHIPLLISPFGYTTYRGS